MSGFSLTYYRWHLTNGFNIYDSDSTGLLCEEVQCYKEDTD
jgi:hypothetical protein